MLNIPAYLSLFEKVIFILASVLYFIFSIVVVKQVAMMSRNVNDKFNAILIIFSWIHLAFSLFLILFTLVL